MKALILVGGLGSRLKPITNSIPKPLVPCSVEKEPLGTAGPIKLAEKYLMTRNATDPNFFLVLNSDIVCDFPFQKMIEFHIQKQSNVTLMVTKIQSGFQRFGIVICDQNTKQIKQFIEKPTEFVGDEINAGVYIINNEMINHIKLRNSSIEREFFPIQSKTGKMYSYLHIGYWKDIGTPVDYLLANQILLKKKQITSLPQGFHLVVNYEGDGYSLIHETSKIHSSS